MIANENATREWLLRQTHPEATDAALCRSLTSTLGVTARARTEARFPPEGGFYHEVTGYDFDIADHAQIPAAIAKVEQALTPATAEHCEGWLVMLQAATAHRQDSEASMAVAYSLYAAELRRWPADVAKAACERLARGRPGQTTTNWFPTLAELARECERLAASRKALHSSLLRWAPEPALPAKPMGDDREAIRRMAAETLAQLQARSETRKKPPVEMPSTAGKVDAGGLTAEMRELMARRGE